MDREIFQRAAEERKRGRAEWTKIFYPIFITSEFPDFDYFRASKGALTGNLPASPYPPAGRFPI
jgi:hypothetical protein